MSMLTEGTKNKIAILQRMAVKVALPTKMQDIVPEKYKDDASISAKIEYIKINDVLTMLLHEIYQKELEIIDVKNATKILLGLAREQEASNE
jgi:hypothetical protein